MTDVAALGFSVDSSPLVKASASLDGLANSAVKAEAATASFNTETSTTATTTARVSPAATAAARAMDAQATSASNAARAMTKASVAATRLAANQNVLRAQTGNIAAQFQDIGVQLASGQSPFLIALQQGTQLSAVLGTVEGGAMGAGRALLGAFGSILSPISLITIGLIAAGGALLQYFTGADDSAEKANATLKKHNDLIKSVATEWGETVPALKSYVDEIERAQKISDLQTVGGEKIANDLASVNAAFDDFVSKNQEVVDAINLAYDATGRSDTALSKFATSWESLSAKIKNGTATQEDFRAASALLGPAVKESGGDLDDFGTSFETISERILNSLKALQQFQEQMRNALITGINVQAQIQNLTTGQINNPNLPDNRFQLPVEGPMPEKRPSDLDNVSKEATGNADQAVNKLAESYRKLIGTQQEQAQNLALEANLIGASVAERARQTAALQAEQELRRNGIDLLSKEGQAYTANAKALADAKTQIDRQQAAYTSLQQAEGNMIDTLVGGLSDFSGSWKDVFKNMAQQALAFINQLAIANPLKNWLTGSNLPTLQDLFAGKPSVPGATTTGTMTVTAATVMVNGGVTGGLPFNPGGGTLLDFLKTPATNGVRPDVVNGQVVNSPVNSAASATVSRLLNPANQNAPVTSADMALYQQAISKIESGSFAGNYSALGPTLKNGDYAIGRYQIMASNVPDWSQKYLGQQITPDQLRANPAYQDAIFNGEFGSYVSKYGASGAASKWFTGSAFPSGKMDALGTTDNSYVKQFNANLSALQQTTSNASTSMTGLTDSSKSLNSGFTNLFTTLGQTPSTTSSSSGGFFSWLGSLFGGGPSVGGGTAGNRVAAAPRPNIAAAPQSVSGGSQKVRVEVVNTVDKSGNLKPVIKSISQETVDERVPGHIKAYDKDHLPKRVRQISGDKWARG